MSWSTACRRSPLRWRSRVRASLYRRSGQRRRNDRRQGRLQWRRADPQGHPTKDVDVCGGPREETLIQVGPDKAVQNAVVQLVDVATGKAWPAAAKTPEIDNVKCVFAPPCK